MQNRPLVSVVIPAYNASRWIADALESITNQSWRDIEIIVVDDGSIDDTPCIVERFSSVKLVSGPNCGPARARNKGLCLAKGKWAIFHDADDYIEAGFVERQVVAAEGAAADLCFGCSYELWPDGRQEKRLSFDGRIGIDDALAAILSDGWYPLHAIMWRTAFVREIGGWNERIRTLDDTELVTRALLRQPVITSSKGSFAVYRQHPDPLRISRREDAEGFLSKVSCLEEIAFGLEPRIDLKRARISFANLAESIACDAYFKQHDVAGRGAEELSRRLGIAARGGSPSHRLAVKMFGLRTKARISRLFHAGLFKRRGAGT